MIIEAMSEIDVCLCVCVREKPVYYYDNCGASYIINSLAVI